MQQMADNREQLYPERPAQGPQPVFGVTPYALPPPIVPMPGPNAASGRYREVGARIRIAFFGAILFLVLSQPAAYRLLSSIYNALLNKQAPAIYDIATPEGFPTVKGLFLGTVLFFVALFVVLYRVA